MVNVGIAGGDDHPIEQRGQLAGVDDLDVLGLDVLEGGDGGPLVVKIVRASDAPGTLSQPKMDEPADG